MPQTPEDIQRRHLLSQAVLALQQGDMPAARKVIGDETIVTLAEAFSHYQLELETQNHELRLAQHRTESLLEWSAQLFRLLPTPAFILNPLGIILEANDKAFDDFSLPPRPDTHSIPLRRLMVHDKDQLRLQNVLHLPSKSQVITLADVVMHGVHGQPVWVTLRIMPMQMRQDLEEARLLCIAEDHTDRIMAQRASEAAQAAAQQRDFAHANSEANHRLMARVSHEFRTPLNAVIGFSELLIRREGRTTDDQVQAFLSHILNAGRHLLELVDEVLQVNRLNGHEEAPIVMESLDARTISIEVVGLMQAMAQRQGIDLTMADHPAVLPRIKGHPRKLREALINLIGNAIKYNVPQGWVRLTMTTHAQHVCISVIDGGRGMDAEQLSSLFQPFNRLGAEKGDQHGHGLGLVITKGLLESMQGRLGVQSAPGVGSCFTLELQVSHDQ